jgi:hypothetical protein
MLHSGARPMVDGVAQAGHFPSQRRFQPPDLAFGALDHLFPPNQMI